MQEYHKRIDADPFNFTAGLVANLARPDGNVTGSSFLAFDIYHKRFETPKEMLPRARRFALLINPDSANGARAVDAATRSAKILKVELQPLSIRSLAEFDSAFSAMHYWGPDPKRLQFLKEAMPQLSRVAFLLDPRQVVPDFIKEADKSAAQQKMKLQFFDVRSVDDFRPAFDAMTKERMQALTWHGGGLLYVERATIAKLALERNLPCCASTRQAAEAGAMMSYGANVVALIRKAPVYIDKILEDAKPADLPVQLPTDFELVINAKVAKSLKVNIPQSLLLLADTVIE